MITEKDIYEVLEEHGLLRQHHNSFTICTDDEVFKKLYAEAGKPGMPCAKEKILWTPFKFKY